MTPFEFACVGDNCIDRFGPPLNVSLVGGNALNVAVQLSQHSRPTAYFGAVGNDLDGDLTINVLAQNNVPTHHIQRQDAATAYTEISFTADGDRFFDFEEFGASGVYRPSALDLDALKNMRHVHIGWLNDGGVTKKFLRKHNVSVSQDLTVNAEPEHLDPDDLSIAFAASTNSKQDAKVLAQELFAGGAHCAIVTCGTAGSVAFDGKNWAETDIVPTNVIDTTGAGDTFAAGVIAALYNDTKSDLQAALEQGRDWAAVTCSHAGGFLQTFGNSKI